MNKKVLVTGGAGFIGSHTVDALIERGDKVRVFDNLNVQVHGSKAEKPLYLHKDAEFIQGDIRDRDSLRKAIEGIDIIIQHAKRPQHQFQQMKIKRCTVPQFMLRAKKTKRFTL